MDFQTSLDYATDSGLHVIRGLDVFRTPIYQRPGDWRCLPVDMYELLQGVIERCLATQSAPGEYLVSPKIYYKEKLSADENIPYAPICEWIERDYPDGNERVVSGYVDNLLDLYPQNLILQAIDDKIWELGQCVEYGATMKSVYGNLKDDQPYFEAMQDATAFMVQAGVGFDPVTNQMQLIPARITGGAPVYGAPSEAVRIYPEMLIDRYKVLQVMKYKKAAWSDGFRISAPNENVVSDGDYYPTVEGQPPPWWTEEYKAGLYNQCVQRILETWVQNETGSNLSTDADWIIQRGMQTYGLYYFFVGVWVWFLGGWGGNTAMHFGPKIKIYGGYPNIPHDVRIWAHWDGTGDSGLWRQFGGEELVEGKNLIFEKKSISGDEIWEGYQDSGTKDFPPYRGALNSQLSVQARPPIEEWAFKYCSPKKPVTWTP